MRKTARLPGVPGQGHSRRLRWARSALAGFLALNLLMILWQPDVASAHPLGNFTVNRYSRIELSPEQVRIRYVLDLAEIPAFQAMPSVDRNNDGVVDDVEKTVYATRRFAEIVRNLTLVVNDRGIALRVVGPEAQLLPGQGGLQTMRLSAWLEAPIGGLLADPGQAGLHLAYRDDNEPDRIGWREILVKSADGIILQGNIPTTDVSQELRAYPEDLLKSPLDVRQIRFGFALGASAGTAASGGTALPRQAVGSSPLARVSDGFADLITTRTWTLPVIVVALVTAMVLGAMHAMSPGHGKTIVGAYLIGSRGTAKHALFLGLTVTVVHTSFVYVLGLATLYAAQYVLPDQIYPWMSLLSGLLVLAMGVSLMNARLHTLGGPGTHAHGHHSHQHRFAGLFHTHEDADGGGHRHVVPGADGAPVTWRSLLAMGVSGGLIPCPSALVMMLGAIALQRVALGLVLLVAFSIGLATSLTAIGLLMVYSGRAIGHLVLARRFPVRDAARLALVVRALPIVGAVVVTLLGVALSVEAAQQLGLPQRLASAPLWQGVASTGLKPLLFAVSALLLGLRHGVDWDHIAAISDVTGTARSRTQGLILSTTYAIGHGLVILILGLLAVVVGLQLPDWVDKATEPLVGVTLVVLAAWLIYTLRRGGEGFRLRSRWLLLGDGLRWGSGWVLARLTGKPAGQRTARTERYGIGTAGLIGALHGIGAETPTQVLLFATAAGVAGAGEGTILVLLFVLGLLISNTAIAIASLGGLALASRSPRTYRSVGVATAVFSLVLGALFIIGHSASLPLILAGS